MFPSEVARNVQAVPAGSRAPWSNLISTPIKLDSEPNWILLRAWLNMVGHSFDLVTLDPLYYQSKTSSRTSLHIRMKKTSWNTFTYSHRSGNLFRCVTVIFLIPFPVPIFYRGSYTLLWIQDPVSSGGVGGELRGFWQSFDLVTYHYRGTSLMRNTPLLGSYSRTIPRALWSSCGGSGNPSIWSHTWGTLLIRNCPLPLGAP